MAKLIVLEEFKNKTKLPVRATRGAAGYDLSITEDMIVPSLWKVIFNNLKEEELGTVKTLEEITDWVKKNNLVTLLSTGLTLECEENEHLDIRPRSGLANKNLLLIPNSPGLVDVDYKNFEIKVGLLNLSPFDAKINKGERIAQAVFEKHLFCEDEEEVTKEREGGFGSSGV